MQSAFERFFSTVPLWFVPDHKWIHEKQKMNYRPKSRDIFKMDRTIDKPGKIDFCKLLSMFITTHDWEVLTARASNNLSSPLSKSKSAIYASPFDLSTLHTVNHHPNQLFRELAAKTSNTGQWILIYASSAPSPNRITPSLTPAIMFTKQKFRSPCQYVNLNNRPLGASLHG